MTFYKFMQQQEKRNDPVGDLARDMMVDQKLFPLSGLPELNVSQWRKRIKEKSNSDGGVMAAFDEAVKEWENEKVN